MDVKEAGRRGGKATADKMTPEQRLERSRNATKALKDKIAKKRLAPPHQSKAD